MTYTTTHLGISVLAIYFLFPKRLREYLKSNPRIFVLTSLGGILPDLDLFTAGHRAYGHTLLFPLVLMIISPLIERISNQEDISKNIRIFGLFWISHLMYDITFGPLALLYPIDPRFYNINIGITFDLTTKIIAPVGLFINVIIIDQRTGVDTFFVNWSPEDRVAVFGAEQINWPISDFFLHTTLFVWYLGFVLYPFFKQSKSQTKTEKDIELSNYLVKLKHWQTPLLMFVLTLSFFIAGPYHGQQWVDTQTDHEVLEISHDTLNFIGSKSIRVPEDSNLDVTILSNYDIVNYSLFLLPMSENEIEKIQSNITSLLDLYQNKTISYSNLIQEYQHFILSSISSTAVRNVTSTDQAKWRFAANTDLSIVFGVFSWEISESFTSELLFKFEWEISLTRSYLIGTIFTILTGSMTSITSYMTYKDLKT